MSKNKVNGARGIRPRRTKKDAQTANFDRAFGIAQDLHQKGHLADAEFAYREILARDPMHAKALHFLGVIAMSANDFPAARELMEKAIAAAPTDATLLANLGALYKKMGDHASAEAVLVRALRQEGPELEFAHANLAISLSYLGKIKQAIPHYTVAIEQSLKRGDPDAFLQYYGLGSCFLEINKKTEAKEALERCVALRPDFIHGWLQLSAVLRNIGAYAEAMECCLKAVACDGGTSHHAIGMLAQIFLDIGDAESAEATLRAGLEASPDNPELLYSMIGPLSAKGRDEEGIGYCLKALEIEPDNHGALVNLTNANRRLHRFDDAEAFAHKALELHPQSVAAKVNYGALCWARGKFEEAEAVLSQALALDPENQGALFNISLAQLANGNLAEGWRNFEYGIFNSQRRPPFLVPIPPWAGKDDDISDKRIFARREQGIGDELMFLSVLTDLLELAGQCYLEVSPKIKSLVARSFPAATVMTTAELLDNKDLVRSMDRQVLLGSLPWRLRPTLADFPNPHVYLKSDPVRKQHFSGRLAKLPGRVKIGFGWRSKLDDKERQRFYYSLEQLKEILTIPDTCFVSAQYDNDLANVIDEVKAAQTNAGVTVHVFEDLDTLDDLDGVAALLDACDLVICPPSTIGRISGALGVPTIEMTVRSLEQHLGTDYSPFAPAIKIIKPDVNYDRDGLLHKVKAYIEAFVAERA